MTLRIAAKYAHYNNFSPNPDEFAHKSQVLAGRNCSTGLLNSPHRTRATFPLVQLNRRVHHDMLPNTARGRWNCVGCKPKRVVNVEFQAPAQRGIAFVRTALR